MTSSAAAGDAQLVHSSLDGNPEAFGQIVARHQALVCSLAYSATGSLTQSEDLAQETFIAAWRHLAKLREPEKLRPWLCGIARNLIHNFLRAQGREPSHRAEPLENIGELPSLEPLPAERAISLEEAEILWRSLERIPEIYREPLILFYRQHQSVEAVAADLELSEEAVRQRLSRGRKLLHEEVLAFVEGALAKTSPGTAFTVMVVAALPLAATTATAASAGVAVAKGGAGAKSASLFSTFGGWAGIVGAILFSWKTAVDETKSPPERRLVIRAGAFQIVFLALCLGAFFLILRLFPHNALALGIALAVLLLSNALSGAVMFDWLGRRRTQIVLEEGSWADMDWSGPGKEANRKALRKTLRLIIPFLILFACGTMGLPWKQHWIRSGVIAGGELLFILWVSGRFYKMLSFQLVPGVKGAWLPESLRHPLILLPALVFGSALLGAGVVIFVNPAAAKVLLHEGIWWRRMAPCFLVMLAGYAAFAVYAKRRGVGLSLGEEGVDNTLFPNMGGILGRAMALTARMLLKSYAPVFGQMNLSREERAQLEALIQRKNAVNMDKGAVLLNAKLDPARRTAAIQDMKSARENCDAQIRQLLGEDNYRIFARFESSLPDRTVLGIFWTKAARSGAALSSETQEQLLAAITSARDQFPWSTDLSRRVPNPPDPAAMFSAENVAVFARQEEEFDRHFLAQAQLILTEKQFALFAPFLAKQRQGKIAVMKMTGKMFSPPAFKS